MPTPPEGQWTIVAEGLGSGTLLIVSDAPNHITGTAFNNRPLIGFFEQKAATTGLSGLPQVPSGTIAFVLDPNASPFHVFTGSYFAFESGGSKTSVSLSTTMAGTVQTLTPGSPGLVLGSWVVQQSQKLKEKDKEEKEKEQSKDNKDTKEHKDSKDTSKEHEKTPRDKLPESPAPPTEPMALLQQLAQRIDVLEQRSASGQAFIQPAERPPVGQQALSASDQSGEVVPAG